MHKCCVEGGCFKFYCLVVMLAAALSACGGGAHAVPGVSSTVQNVQSAVQVSSPVNNSTVGTSVTYVASATTTCSGGIASMGVFTAPGVLAYKANGATLNANLTFNPGSYNTTVEAWDNCGGIGSAPIRITVSSTPPSGPGPTPPPPGTTFSSLQQKGGWTGYVLLPPLICDLLFLQPKRA